MNCKILPHEGVEFLDGRYINFGMTPEQIIASFGEPDYTQMQDSTLAGYDYYRNDFIVHFKDAGQSVECILILSPSQASLDDEPLLNRPYSEVVEYLASLGGEIEDIQSQPFFRGVGIAPYDDPPGELYSLHIFEKGYMDDWQKTRNRIAEEVAAMPKLSEEERRAEMDELLHIDLDKFLES